jgi:hypothetical protein
MSKEAFEKKRRDLKEKLNKEPLCFTDILVDEKISM